MTEENARNIASVSWGDHLTFGEDDGLLDTPAKLLRRMEVWRDELGVGSIQWRHGRRSRKGSYHVARGYNKASSKMNVEVDWDDYKTVPRLARGLDLKANLYVSLFAEGWPLAPKKERAVSHHNPMHAQHFSWQSHFSRENPDYLMLDRSGAKRQWGVLCLAYPQVREYLRNEFLSLLNGYEWDGLFICLRTEARPADFADEFGFNEPIRRDYKEIYGRDILNEDFDVQSWRKLLGSYLTEFLSELRTELSDDVSLSIGCARGDVVGPPMGNAALEWPLWVERNLIDALIIDQNSSQCPSLWHQLWPMHRGYGYVHNYLDGYNMMSLKNDLNKYYSVMNGYDTHLYLARQWSERSTEEETNLLGQQGVEGLVFSTFRHDNPGPLMRGDWVVGPDNDEL